MRVAVSSDDKKSTSYQLSNARGFMIYDIDDEQVRNQFYRCYNTPEYSRNSRELEKFNQNAHQIIKALLDCDAVIACAIDKELIDELNRAGIETYVTEEKDISKARKYYAKRILDSNPESGSKYN